MAGFDNFPLVIRQIRLYADGLRAGSVEAAVTEAHGVLRDALPITPIDTGALRRSGRVEGPRKQGGGGSRATLVTVSFGGPSTPRYVDYAVYVHEIAEARHAPPTQWKFLETVWNRRRSTMAARIASVAAARARRAAKR